MAKKTYAARVTSKGQITIPREVCRRLGIRTGDRLEFVAEDNLTIIRRASARTNPFAKYEGALGGFPTGKKQIDAWIRDLRDPG